MDNIIRLDKVSKIYGSQIKTQVLFDLDLQIKARSFNGIIGASGSGKSTLLNIVGTLDKPTRGNVIINGTETSQMNKNQLARLRNETIGFIFQFHYLLPEFTAFENVLMPHFIKGQKVDKIMNKRAHELMDLVGLSKVKNNLAGNMSGGQQQRTAIARALINNPRIILADEPTGNLDSETTEVIYELLRDINKQFETTFIIITHDRRIAEKTDRIIEIKDGRIYNDFSRI
ncbi:MAG TPA: lipoprotein-releasing system ATP-binding protein LolD [Clostridiales bacterium UBA8960]|jgi:lipoprotein-releasing system ATP-binding protein|nr:lipoprotein-releasing system ATP-binding protein LolD [Clostridiales bacterium UBA8960]